jgi:hypothetical protein
MSQIRNAIFGAVAVSLTLGAAQLASGHDLTAGQQALNDTPQNIINRSGKADRAAGLAGASAQTRTISLRLDSLSDTSVLVRVPVVKKPETEARNRPAAPSLFNSGGSKRTVACEPMVSVLTEVAKQLQPGRCVT